MAHRTEHYTKDKRGKYRFKKPIEPDYIVELAVSILESRYKRGPQMTKPEESGQFFQLKLGGLEQEVFGAAYLDTRHHLIEYENLFYGTVDGSCVHQREVVKRALYYNASAAVFGHNHPSGVPEPSPSDRAITKRLYNTLSVVDVRVLDHIVVSETGYVSMAERRMF